MNEGALARPTSSLETLAPGTAYSLEPPVRDVAGRPKAEVDSVCWRGDSCRLRLSSRF